MAHVHLQVRHFQHIGRHLPAPTAAEGFDREILFTNEESVDWVNRTGNAWPAVIGADEARQSGVVVAYDVETREDRPIWGMGRHNHENSVAIPGYGKPVVLSGDDTFTSNPAQSQLYSYIADDADAVWNDEGDLYGLVLDNAAINDYYDYPVGTTMSEPGTFKKIAKADAAHVELTEAHKQALLELGEVRATIKFQKAEIEDYRRQVDLWKNEAAHAKKELKTSRKRELILTIALILRSLL